MKSEIGGYIELDEFTKEEYYPNLISLNSARNALVYLIKARGITKICLPYFLCDCVSRVCVENNCEIIFYHIGLDFRPDPAFIPLADSWFYIVNYYGQLSCEEIQKYKKKYPNLILDNVQAFFQEPIDGIDTIYTLRKYFGVPDGAYLATDSRLVGHLDTDKSAERMIHLLGRYEGCAGDYYNDYKNAEEEYYTLPLRYMSKLTHNLLRGIDYDFIIKRREENWEILSASLGGINKLNLTTPIAPFMYPLYIKNGDMIKKCLAEKKIYIPTLWPDVMEIDSSETERKMALNILPLPIDQRYGEEDMKRITDELEKHYNV